MNVLLARLVTFVALLALLVLATKGLAWVWDWQP